ncbi:phage tail family protein [Staphylococcus saprophyticus]|uniref:phage tail domain-containing protein n=1 Tax=Staphylococcus saprophyticus TaxID=29385 RepID=UPI001A8CB566|nr:phage tail domain-containing protein [Staphylococcus saprophyticus]MBO0382611.1 phage tail family protein [Staphylococcus saprophyticus]
MKKWVKMITDNGTTDITDIDGLMYLDFKEEDVENRINLQEISGVDGGLLSPISFAPFNLILRFVYSGVDVTDYHLLKKQLRSMLYSRTPFYIVHSDMPGMKYAVVTDSTAVEDVYGRNGTFEVTFTVYKGYSESLYETNEYDKTSDKWQFGNGLLVNDDIKYKHNTTSFKIFNGSSDTIAPFPHKHKLIIKLNVNAPKGFKLINRTTGDVFEYKKAITKNKQIIINGIYPTIDGKRVGIDTNHEWLTLAPGYNDIEIIGTDITEPTAEFIFPFIYR